MVDVADPTSFGTDLVHTVDDPTKIEFMPGDEEKQTDDSKPLYRGREITILTEDRDWGNQGQGKPVLLQHGHYMDSQVWFKEKKVGKPIPLQLFDAGYDVWLGNNRGSYNCELQTGRQSQKN